MDQRQVINGSAASHFKNCMYIPQKKRIACTLQELHIRAIKSFLKLCANSTQQYTWQLMDQRQVISSGNIRKSLVSQLDRNSLITGSQLALTASCDC